ncbi:hypothetical protein ACFO9Q_09785 [Paenibacillus sp. GCM10023252]|uniref:hypothetical protein n=1 Tax=Paenibacillus sp. GCM10023252 TaxID=3252649 RepID=UPI003619B3B5
METDKKFYSDSVKMVNIFESVIDEKRHFKRSEMNALNSYDNKYKKVNGPIYSKLIDFYVSLLFDMKAVNTEDDVYSLVNFYKTRLEEIKKNMNIEE